MARPTASASSEHPGSPVIGSAVDVHEPLPECAPAGLPDIAIARADPQAGAAHRCHERARGRPVRGRRDTEHETVVAEIAGGEVDADPLDGTLLDRLLDRLDEARRQRLAGKAVRIGDDVREVLIDDMVQGRVQVAVVVRRPDEENVRAGGHRVHRLDVERLLDVPALRVLCWVLRAVEDARSYELVELVPREHMTGVVELRVGLRVREDHRRRVGVDDRDRLAGAVEPRCDAPSSAIGATQHRRRVPVRCPGERVAENRGDVVGPEGREGAGVTETERRWRIRGRGVRANESRRLVQANHRFDDTRER